MIALSEVRCKGRFRPVWARPMVSLRKSKGHGIVSGIILPPHFRPSPAPLTCEDIVLRWPGPFGSGFLSPQPPGAVGIGPVRRGVKSSTLGQRKLVLFAFWDTFTGHHSGRSRNEQTRNSEIMLPVRSGEQGSGFAATRAPLITAVLSATTSLLRPASGPACRGCRPGHTPRRHRRPRARYFPAARSSFPNCRSSRRPSTDCAPRCSR